MVELDHHKLCPTYGDNILSPDRATLIAGIIEGYELDVAKWRAKELRDRVMSTDVP